MVSKKMILIKIGVQNVLYSSDIVNKSQKVTISPSKVSFIVTLPLSATGVVIFQVLVIQEDWRISNFNVLLARSMNANYLSRS